MKPLTRAMCALACACLSLTLAQGGKTATESFAVTGHILGASGKSTIYVALWQADGFLDDPVQQVVIAPGQPLVYKFQVAKGRWALSAFEDRNGNNVLDIGPQGPKEPSGFWPTFAGQGEPKFDEVASLIDKDVSDADINLK
jgi:uncharacterized protein (DUF2141 family)